MNGHRKTRAWSRALKVGLCTVLLLMLVGRSGCGRDLEHVPNPFEFSQEEVAREKVFVVGSGPSSSDPDRSAGLVTVIAHGGRTDLEASGPIETALTGNSAAAAAGHVYVGNPDDESVTSISAATDEIEGVVRVGIRPGVVALDPSERFVFVANRGAMGDTRLDSVSVIDVVPTTTTFLQEIARIPVQDSADDVTFSTRRDRAFVSNRLSGTVSVIDTDSANVTSFLSVIASIPIGPLPGVMTYSAESGHVYVALNAPTSSESVAIIDADRLGSPDRLPGIPQGDAVGQLTEVTFLQASRDGNVIWASFLNGASGGGGIAAIDVAADRVMSRLDLAGFSPNRLVEADGVQLFVSGREGTNEILVVDASFPLVLQEVARLRVGMAGNDRPLALSVDRTRVYVPNTGEVSGSVSVIDVATVSVMATVPTHGTHPHAIVAVDVTGLAASEEDDFGEHGHDPAHHSP